MNNYQLTEKMDDQIFELLSAVQNLKKNTNARKKNNATPYNNYLKSFYKGSSKRLPVIYQITTFKKDLEKLLTQIKMKPNLVNNSITQEIKEGIQYLTNLIRNIQTVNTKKETMTSSTTSTTSTETLKTPEPAPPSVKLTNGIAQPQNSTAAWSSIFPLSGVTSSISKGIANPIPPVPAVINPPGPVPPTPAPKVDWYRNHGEPRTQGKVSCDQGKKTWYHHEQYCACTYNDFANLINDDIQSNRNPLDRVQACIDARIYERDTVFRGRGDQSHEAAIQKMEQLKEGIQSEGSNIKKYSVIVGKDTVAPGEQFYVQRILTGARKQGGRRSTRKTNRKQRKQTRRRR